ncbi:MAG: hypothetical protein IPK39_21705 [Sulfuritalea sp.]|nr:hypothetical protein [Sulfuritalea sp.]
MGRMVLVKTIPVRSDAAHYLALAAALERGSRYTRSRGRCTGGAGAGDRSGNRGRRVRATTGAGVEVRSRTHLAARSSGFVGALHAMSVPLSVQAIAGVDGAPALQGSQKRPAPRCSGW